MTAALFLILGGMVVGWICGHNDASTKLAHVTGERDTLRERVDKLATCVVLAEVRLKNAQDLIKSLRKKARARR